MTFKLKKILNVAYNRLSLAFYRKFYNEKDFEKLFFNKKNIKQIGIVETSKKLTQGMSIGRFGDGELSWIFMQDNGIKSFEDSNKELSVRLKEVIESDDPGFLVGIPDSISYLEELPYTNDAKTFWRAYLLKNRNKILSVLDERKSYYDANVTRPYMDYNTSSLADDTFKNLKKIWYKKNILIIEGNKSTLGAFDDLFEEARDIKRIECPSTGAFQNYDAILKESSDFLQNHEDYISLISLGPTATILAYDLFKKGFQAIDMGHIDVEYEWYLRGAKERIQIPNKYINELKNGKETGRINNSTYTSQIVSIIEEKE